MITPHKFELFLSLLDTMSLIDLHRDREPGIGFGHPIKWFNNESFFAERRFIYYGFTLTEVKPAYFTLTSKCQIELLKCYGDVI